VLAAVIAVLALIGYVWFRRRRKRAEHAATPEPGEEVANGGARRS
jgi:hypothetical protein